MVSYVGLSPPKIYVGKETLIEFDLVGLKPTVSPNDINSLSDVERLDGLILGGGVGALTSSVPAAGSVAGEAAKGIAVGGMSTR